MSLNFTETWTNMSPNFNVHVFCNGTEIHDHFSSSFTAFIIVWLSLIMAGDLVGNTMTIWVIVKNPNMRSSTQTTNFFLLNLAIADLLVTIVIPFSIHSVYMECWDIPLFWCKINSFFVTLSLVTSIHTLMYISIHKFTGVRRLVVNNDLHSSVSGRTCFIMIGITWTYAAVFSIATVISGPIFKEKTIQCGPKYPVPGEASFYLHIANQIFNVFIPLTVLVFCYICLFLYIRCHANVQRQMTITPNERVQTQSEKGVALTLVIVIACFSLSWLPYTVYTNYATFVKEKHSGIPNYFNPLAYCFGYMNSACNPLIYAWRFPQFRQGYKDILNKTKYFVTVVDGGRRIRRPVFNNRTENEAGHRMSRPSINDVTSQ
ncbi:galanin receptor type 1-like [Saccostrea echinata]|uniref:galanin receptor type 1-like n=1 Tax=Saccostrea echinata TaxID=191078 RepID=UPI002A82C076|nr:galanin receptor type 1-like [Saccostrea echinata]